MIVDTHAHYLPQAMLDDLMNRASDFPSIECMSDGEIWKLGFAGGSFQKVVKRRGTLDLGDAHDRRGSIVRSYRQDGRQDEREYGSQQEKTLYSEYKVFKQSSLRPVRPQGRKHAPPTRLRNFFVILSDRILRECPPELAMTLLDSAFHSSAPSGE